MSTQKRTIYLVVKNNQSEKEANKADEYQQTL